MNTTPSRRPNVLLFISDQQRADTMPGVTQVHAHTPHMAWLTETGVAFRNAFCTSPICTPARGSILSGLFPHTTGVVANYDVDPLTMTMRDDIPLIADHLRPEGYACAYVGKWHLPTGDDRRGFRDFVTRLNKMDVDSVESDDAIRFAKKIGVNIGRTYGKYLSDDKGDLPTGGGATKLPLAFHPSTLQAQQAAHFIRTQKDSDQPFLLTYSCIEPHPLGRQFNISPCPFDRMYDPAAMPLAETRRDPRAPHIVRNRNFGGLLPTDRYSDDELRAMIAGYYGAVSYTDHLLGIILEALIDSDQLEDTLVIFTSDHGEMLGHHRMLKKGPVMFEDMINVPLVIRSPGETRDGMVIEDLVSHVDLLPTILSQCGIDGAEGLPGCDLTSVLDGGEAPARDGVAVEYHSSHWGQPPFPLRCWRTMDWKYVETVGGDNELYHLAEDPGETRNLIDDPSAASQRDRLRLELHAWLEASNDPWPEIAQPDIELPARVGEWAKLADGT